ncbi:MAG: hypothetical protein HWE20_13135 [Gammaproteobacteria bacterium]|nr:hypothetical protein [Gammaproteobacteria bacterium]
MAILGGILWPSFFAAGIANSLVFTFLAPEDLNAMLNVFEMSSTAWYSIGFFGFWSLTALSSIFTTLLLSRLWTRND